MNKEKVKTFEDIIKKNHPNICGVVVLKDDKLVYENYENNCNKESKIHIYSVTKSIISLLIGIALDKGYIKESTSPHINLGDLSYGYLWWILDDHSFIAMGDGGNSIYVDTKDNIVIAISALFVPNSSEKIELIKHYIKPAFE